MLVRCSLHAIEPTAIFLDVGNAAAALEEPEKRGADAKASIGEIQSDEQFDQALIGVALARIPITAEMIGKPVVEIDTLMKFRRAPAVLFEKAGLPLPVLRERGGVRVILSCWRRWMF